MQAHEYLELGISHMKDRAQTYDSPQGERSIEKTVNAFNALTGHSVTAEQGWLFMALLKMARTQQGKFRQDNYEDLAAYAGLMGEQAEKDRVVQQPAHQITSPHLKVSTVDPTDYTLIGTKTES